MKQMKAVVGLLACAAIAVGALGATTALGAESTKLCKANESHCSAANTYSAKTEFQAKGTISIEEKASPDLDCQAELSGHLAASGGAPLLGSSHFLYTECRLGPTERCTTVDTGTGSTTTEATTGGNGVMADNWQLNYTCGALFNCIYSTPAANARFTGGPLGQASLVWNKVTITNSGKACPVSTMSAQLVFTEPGPVGSVFVTH